MKLQTEALTIEAAGTITMGAASELDATLATLGFYPPQLANASLPAAAGVEGAVFYDLTNNKLVFSNGAAYETVTSA